MKTTTKLIAFLLAGLTCARPVIAASITLASGEVVQGRVLQKEAAALTVSADYGVLRLPLEQIKTVDGKPVSEIAAPTTTSELTKASQPEVRSDRFPRWSEIIAALSRQPWATNLQQIPATVVDKGAMRNVPYSSYKCGEDYELNIYGDPDNPAGVEIGVYRNLLNNDAAKENCVAFISSILGDTAARSALKTMNRHQALTVSGGLSIEITPETAVDAYGGWWVSAYKEKALTAMRASDAEVARISVARNQAAAAEKSAYAWTQSDISKARPAAPATASVDSSALPVSTGGGRVYVRGYYRKDGTYVRPHTRSR